MIGMYSSNGSIVWMMALIILPLHNIIGIWGRHIIYLLYIEYARNNNDIIHHVLPMNFMLHSHMQICIQI